MRMVVTCAGCQRPIVDKFLLNVLDQVWHDTCVQCSDCKRPLADKCFSREGKIYCKDDFFRRYGAKCSGCLQGLSPHDLVRKAMNRFYHLNCFTCMVCRRQLSTGEELYILDENHFICKDDYSRCQKNEDDIASETENDPFPETRLMTHADVTLFDKDLSDNCGTNEYDEEDDDDDEGDDPRDVPCIPLASDGIATRGDAMTTRNPSKVVMDSSVGDEGSLYAAEGSVAVSKLGECSAEQVDMDASNCSSFSGESNNNNNALNNNNNNNNSDKGSEVKDAGSTGENSLPVGAAVGAKRRGPRTTIKAKQLETLKAAFAATPKPTRHIREQLAQETGLNMRVIQVWFQNRRSKERRMKQLSVLGARRQFFRSPRRLRLFRPGDELIDGHHDHMAAAAAAAAAFGYFAGPTADGGDFFPGYGPTIYGASDFYPANGIDPSHPVSGSAAGLAFLPPPPPSSGIGGHQAQGVGQGPQLPLHLHEQLHHDRLREGVYLTQRLQSPAEGLDLTTAQPSPSDAHLRQGPGTQAPTSFQSLLQHQDFYGGSGPCSHPPGTTGDQRMHPSQGVGHPQTTTHSHGQVAVATW